MLNAGHGESVGQIIHTSSKVLLADASGVVLHSFGDHEFFGKASKILLLPGGIWSEGFRGTNAIGTALVEQEPVMVHSAEHFITSNHCLPVRPRLFSIPSEESRAFWMFPELDEISSRTPWRCCGS